jgi:hypothetical protein
MRTSGSANDAVMVVVPLAVLVFVAMVLLGGPANFLDTSNRLIGSLVRGAAALFSSLTS